MTRNIPTDGSTIIFERTPQSSWSRTGEPYKVQVSRSGLYIHLTSIGRGSSTFDKAWQYREAVWHYAA